MKQAKSPHTRTCKPAGRIWDYLIGRQSSKATNAVKGWLRRRGEHHRCSIVGAELANTIKDWGEQVWWQGLRFIKDNDAAGEAVQLAAAAGLISKQALEELQGGRDNDGRVPVFCCETCPHYPRLVLVCCVAPGRGAAVVLQDYRPVIIVRLENGAICTGGLLGDADIGHRHNHALKSITQGVAQGERHP